MILDWNVIIHVMSSVVSELGKIKLLVDRQWTKIVINKNTMIFCELWKSNNIEFPTEFIQLCFRSRPSWYFNKDTSYWSSSRSALKSDDTIIYRESLNIFSEISATKHVHCPCWSYALIDTYRYPKVSNERFLKDQLQDHVWKLIVEWYYSR